jgi:hypothetical protein
MRAMVIVDVAPEISASEAERIRDFASTRDDRIFPPGEELLKSHL